MVCVHAQKGIKFLLMDNKSYSIHSKSDLALDMRKQWFSTLRPRKVLVSSDSGFQEKRKELTFE